MSKTCDLSRRKVSTAILLIAGLAISGCSSNPQMQRTFGYGPYQYCEAGHTCFQAGETWKFYPFAPEDVHRYAQQGRECWAESNRANWDLCGR